MSINSTGLSEWEGALVVKPATAWRMLGCSNTYGYELLAAGELDSFRDGRARKITVDSIRRYIARRLAESKGKRGRGRPRKIDAQIKTAASQEVTP
jgi:excisionase family DNA binding protein